MIDRQITWHIRAEKVVNRVCTAFPPPEFENWKLCEELILSATAACKQIQQFSIANENAALLLNEIAYYLRERAKYTEALPLCQQALQITEQVLGKQHPDYAASLNNFAALYKSQGDHEKALPLYQQALQIAEKVSGKQHPAYAQSLNNLAELYKAQGNYEIALPLHQQVLQIVEKVSGKQHPDYATGLNNLATLYHFQGNYENALLLYQEILQIQKKALGKLHPNNAAIPNLKPCYGNGFYKPSINRKICHHHLHLYQIRSLSQQPT